MLLSDLQFDDMIKFFCMFSNIATVQIFAYTTRTSGNEDKVEEREITRHDPRVNLQSRESSLESHFPFLRAKFNFFYQNIFKMPCGKWEMRS